MKRKRRKINTRQVGHKFEREMTDYFNAKGHEAFHTGRVGDKGADIALKLFGLSRTLKPQCKSNFNCWHDLYRALQEGRGVALLEDRSIKPARPVVALYLDMWIDHLDYSREMRAQPQPVLITDYP